MNIFQKIMSHSIKEQSTMKAPIIEEKVETEIVVYVLEDRFNHLTLKDLLEVSMVIHHHMLLISENEITKIETQVGNFWMFEEQWVCLNKRSQSLWKKVSVSLI